MKNSKKIASKKSNKHNTDYRTELQKNYAIYTTLKMKEIKQKFADKIENVKQVSIEKRTVNTFSLNLRLFFGS